MLTAPAPTMKKILVFCSPYVGHFTVLKSMIRAHSDEFEFKLVLTSWTNWTGHSPVEDPFLRDAVVLARSELTEPSSLTHVLPQVAALIEDSLAVTRDYEPDLIIYDWMSPVGYFVGRKLGIPYWCSLAAFLGSSENSAYLRDAINRPCNRQAVREIREATGIEITAEDIELICDGLLLPGMLNLVWSYAPVAPANMLEGRHNVPFVFTGNLAVEPARTPQEAHDPPVVYFSLGTVVLNCLLDRVNAPVRHRLIPFVQRVAELTANKHMRVIFPTVGKEILRRYPPNWEIHAFVDQVAVLRACDVFLTHGGTNSFHEAILLRKPMVVLPFYGDQILAARRAEELGIGIDVGPKDGNIDTTREMDFLHAGLGDKVVAAIETVLQDPAYARRCQALRLEATSIKDLIHERI